MKGAYEKYQVSDATRRKNITLICIGTRFNLRVTTAALRLTTQAWIYATSHGIKISFCRSPTLSKLPTDYDDDLLYCWHHVTCDGGAQPGYCWRISGMSKI